ncbi:hypothetical protein [Streptomyces sp. ST1015]|uniref:hypothetical protein n=1 Tax=Streptomyces sp. ST1015 TaxID=1848900 RepID=UPI001CA603FE|nr:hypothetical protein [Streptomyces sp. ST1015]QZZ30522.1 hypothetical protein A7X85_33640 [Streptomyces sp. ST1015]
MPGLFDPRGIGPLPPFLAATPCGAVARVRMPTGDPMWLVTDHAVGRAALADPRLSRAAAARPDAPKWGSVDLSPNSVMSLDGADHARLRRIAAGRSPAPGSPRGGRWSRRPPTACWTGWRRRGRAPT